jgi:hypothetical protein
LHPLYVPLTNCHLTKSSTTFHKAAFREGQ